ncbi:GNAT family N-acetyltransferase [Colwellia demingiae]|uniref:GNAT family N-acetyltransferase n=1 Tax=Colwellia demingiae TaxID=89401 RepID=A0A5C6Q3Y4_9GAMM|nr:GNAT family N-acetyltransferase [Colwellia demingiae]TWX63556.1 GNAT family N-acetyltransferase [Colwellia demingiae]
MIDLFRQNIIVENRRVRLVPFTHESSAGLVDIVYDEETWLHMPNNIKNRKDFENYVNETVSEREKDISYPFIVIDKASGKIAGSTRLALFDYDVMSLEVGWTWFCSEFRGTGLNKACKHALLNYLFSELEFERISFCVESSNTRSRKAVLKLGATEEGTMRKCFRHEDGNLYDYVMFSLLKDEWPKINRETFSEFNIF